MSQLLFPLIIVFLHIVCFNKLTQCRNSSTLVGALVVFRHGERAPVKFFGKDPYATKVYWPEGFGQLTKEGKIGSYRLGQWLRRRFDGFLSKKFARNELYFRTVDKERTMISSMLVTAGLYPKLEETPNSSPGFQIVPVYSTPIESDILLHMFSQCPKYNDLFDSKFKGDFPRHLVGNFTKSQLTSYIEKHVGRKMHQGDVMFLHNTWSIENTYNQTLPEWSRGIFPEVTGDFMALGFQTRTSSEQMTRLIAGNLFNEIKNHFVDLKNNGNGTKVRLYCGHDATLVDLLNGMEIYDLHLPQPLFTLIFELIKREGSYFINLTYKKGNVIEKLLLPSCHFDCEFDRFLKILEPIAVNKKEWEQECNDNEERNKETFVLLICSTVLSLCFGIVICLIKKCSAKCLIRDEIYRHKPRNCIPKESEMIENEDENL